MILLACSVFDVKAGAFIQPFFLQNRAMAHRAFRDCALDETHMFCKHPNDYALYEVGEFDDATGEFRPYVPILHQGLAINFQYTESGEDLNKELSGKLDVPKDYPLKAEDH